MRVDRFFEARFPGPVLQPYPAHHPQRRGAGERQARRAQGPARGGPGDPHPAAQARCAEAARRRRAEDEKTRAFLKSITLYEDDDVMVLNKPMGLAVQGGSGTDAPHRRHARGVARPRDGQRPRLVHRLDKDTAGCLLVAKTRFAAAALAKNLPLALGAQDLLGAGRRRAEAEAGPHLDLPRQGGARGGQRHARSPSMARRARATPSPITRWSRPRRSSSPGCRSSR